MWIRCNEQGSVAKKETPDQRFPSQNFIYHRSHIQVLPYFRDLLLYAR